MNSIAIIEPNGDVREQIRGLISEDYVLSYAKDGKEGVNLVRNSQPTIIIANTELDCWNGFQLLELVRQDEQLARIPVILYSESHDQDEIIQALQAGANGFIKWPLEMELLGFKIQNLIEWEKNPRPVHAGRQMDKAGRFMAMVNEVIEKNLDNVDLNMQDIADAMGVSSSSLQKNLKKYRDKSVSQYVREYRLLRSRDLIEARGGKLSEISARSGFRNLSYFSKSFKNYFGFPPSSLS